MNTPSHHLDDDLLLAYVTGAATEPVALVAACHLTLCMACRERATAAEMVGGALLDAAGPSDQLSPDALERMLARLDGDLPVLPADARAGADVPFVFAGVSLPRPLERYLARDDQADSRPHAFRFLAPGVRGIDLEVTAPPVVRTRLLRLNPGVEIPRHTHAAPEFTVVFAGGLSDGGEHYVRGDVRFRDTGAEHVQVVDPEGPCVALVVNEGALLPRTWRGKLVSLLFDR